MSAGIFCFVPCAMRFFFRPRRIISPTQDLLISIDAMPPNWEISSGPGKVVNDTIYYPKDESYITFIVVGANPELKGAQHVVFQYSSSSSARDWYKDFFVGKCCEEPDNWSYHSSIADQSYFVCYDYEGRHTTYCSWIALYEEFIVEFDAWMIKPLNFEPRKKYPVMFFIYGEPASATVKDKWSGNLWDQLLAQEGYIVISVDNRGTNTPRGREWRKC